MILNCRTNADGPISGRDFVDICLWKKITDEKGGTVTYISAGASYLENDDIKRKIDEHFPLPRGNQMLSRLTLGRAKSWGGIKFYVLLFR